MIYAQEHLAERGQRDPTVLNQLERTLALLAFDPPDASPFADLLHPSHRQKVASELNAAILEAQNQEQVYDHNIRPAPIFTFFRIFHIARFCEAPFFIAEDDGGVHFLVRRSPVPPTLTVNIM